jgi:ATP-dependent Lon protease
MALFSKPAKVEAHGSGVDQDLAVLQDRIEKADLPGFVSTVAAKEITRLEKTDSSSPEYLIGISYIEYLLALPWNQFTEDLLDLKRAEAILEKQHYGLSHVKERILEFLAVRTRVFRHRCQQRA